ncbi:zinc finger, PHD-type containing protein [Tanacetum coccineum]
MVIIKKKDSSDQPDLVHLRNVIAKYNLEDTNIGRDLLSRVHRNDWNLSTRLLGRTNKKRTDDNLAKILSESRFHWRGDPYMLYLAKSNLDNTDIHQDLNPLDYAAIDLVGRRFNDVTPKAYHVETNNQDSSEDTIDEHWWGCPKHEHPIELSDESDISCDICKEDIAKGSPRYNCTDKCQYNVHTTCAISPPVRTTEALYVEYEKSSERVPNLPFPDNPYSLVKHYFLKLESKAHEINHFIHHHQLVLFNQVAEETGLSLSGVLIKLQKKFKLTCKLCGQLITEVPFYRCPEECCLNFMVHEWCAYLPTMLKKSPCHTQHPLILKPKYSQLTGCLGLFKCDACDLWCNGFSFSCYEFDFHVDINCAFLLKNIKHSAHPLHPLRFSPFRIQNKLKKCVACSVKLDDGIFVYQCFKCNFFIHTECSLLPRKIKHRYVKNSYKLTYSPPRTNLDYLCDICEEEIDINQWFYDCDPMVVSVHAAFGGCVKPYNKVLRLIRIGNHPHGFSLISATKQETIFSVCQKPVSTFPFFKCSTCGISVDSWCVLGFII